MRFELTISDSPSKKETIVNISGNDDLIVVAIIKAMNDCPELKDYFWKAILVDTLSDTPDRRAKQINVRK